MARLHHAGVESRADRRGLQRRAGQVGAVLDRQHGHERHGAEHRTGRQVLARQRSLADNADDKASFWTTTKTDATTAQMFEVFGWSNEIVPWNFNSRPWSEGDGTASMLVNVRCVRDRD